MARFSFIALLGIGVSPLLSSALKIASALNVIEYSPEIITKDDYYKGDVTITNGGVANIVTDTTIDLATNAETQALRQYAQHKNLRIIYTVAEVPYRLVANKKTVTSLKDLKGKKIATFAGTSAAYFIQRMLASVGLQESDVTIVSGNVCSASPCGAGTLPYMLTHGTADAIGMWEPTAELAIEALGADNAAVFQNKTAYREIFNLHSTAEKLKDAATRKNIVDFLKGLNKAQNDFAITPDKVIPRVASTMGIKADLLKAVWPVHIWNTTLPSDMLDVLAEEDQWVAKQDRRTAVSKADLATLIDSSVWEEAQKG